MLLNSSYFDVFYYINDVIIGASMYLSCFYIYIIHLFSFIIVISHLFSDKKYDLFELLATIFFLILLNSSQYISNYDFVI